MADRFEEEAQAVLERVLYRDAAPYTFRLFQRRDIETLADALRKAEARGMREAARLAAMPGRDHRLAEQLIRMAEKLEKGE